MKQKQIIEIAKTIEINTEYLKSISEESKTLKYLNSLDLEKMPTQIREMNINLLAQTKKNLDPASQKEIVKPNTKTEKTESEKYINSYFEIDKLLKESEITNSYKNILSADIKIVESVTTKIKEMLTVAEDNYKKNYADLITHIEKKIKEEYFGETYITPKSEIATKGTIVKNSLNDKNIEKKINYIVRKSRLSINEIRELLVKHIKKNELIYNKIIFEGKGVTLSIVDRILGITYKHGTGYIVNFISEPDSNFGRFYQNILKVFKIIKEKMYIENEVVIEPEDGRGLIFLNSFYQNYMFIKDKLSSILLKYKLQNSMLNENFTVKHMIFNKNTNKYMIFYTGNKELYRAAEQYLNNQAKLGPVSYSLEFIESTDDSINNLMMDLYDKIINRIDLNTDKISFKIKSLSNERNEESALLSLSGVNILLDPVSTSKLEDKNSEMNLDIDVIILTHARKEMINEIPAIMVKYPNARLFTSDITYRIARINWLEAINSANTYDSPVANSENNSLYNFTKKDIDNLSERIIKITPEGKGYNFKRMVNIKFFNAGLIPGAAVVEFQDSKSKIIYLSDFNLENSGLIKGSDIKLENYDFVISKSGIPDDESIKKLPVELIKEKIENGKQVFLFSDEVGNLQHLTSEITMSKFDYPIMSGNHIYGLVNKEISKLINFGSSWGENFQEKELFIESITCIQPFIDEYEFYKKFSTDNPYMFIVPFGSDELDMIIKNKLETGSIVVLPPYRLDAYNERLNKYTEIVDNEDIKNNKPIVYNYISKISDSKLANELIKCSKLKKVFILNDKGFSTLDEKVATAMSDKLTFLGLEKEIEVY